MELKWEVFLTAPGKWSWRIKCETGEVVQPSIAGCETEEDAIRAVHTAIENMRRIAGEKGSSTPKAPKEPHRVIQVVVPETVYQRLRGLADGRPISSLMRVIVLDWLKKKEVEDGDTSSRSTAL